MTTDADFRYSDLLPIGPDETPYRLLTTEGVSTFEADGRTFLRVVIRGRFKYGESCRSWKP